MMMSGYDFLKSQVLRRRWQNADSDWDVVMSSGRVFQTRGPATGKARLPFLSRNNRLHFKDGVKVNVSIYKVTHVKLIWDPKSHEWGEKNEVHDCIKQNWENYLFKKNVNLLYSSSRSFFKVLKNKIQHNVNTPWSIKNVPLYFWP